jgi:hypothetical protein
MHEVHIFRTAAILEFGRRQALGKKINVFYPLGYKQQTYVNVISVNSKVIAWK